MAIKVGVLIDFAWGYPEAIKRCYEDCLEFAFADALADGVIDREVELVWRHADGLPVGDAHQVLRAWRELAEEEGCVAIFGPVISENAIALRDYIERQGRVPSITWAGTDLWNGQWCYALGQGSLTEEPYLMTNYLAHIGVRKVAAIVEQSAIGVEYFSYFRQACAFDGLSISGYEEVTQIQTDLRDTVARVREIGADALAYFGFGLPAIEINGVLDQMGWNPTRVMTAAFLTAPIKPTGWKVLQHWVGCDLYDEDNPVGQDFLDRFERRFGYRPENFLSVTLYDVGQILAQGIGKARPLSPDGVRRGLDAVKMLPAASGVTGTMLGLGPYDHKAWVGSGYLLMKRVRSEYSDQGLTSPGSTEVVHRLTPRSVTERRALRAAL